MYIYNSYRHVPPKLNSDSLNYSARAWKCYEVLHKWLRSGWVIHVRKLKGETENLYAAQSNHMHPQIVEKHHFSKKFFSVTVSLLFLNLPIHFERSKRLHKELINIMILDIAKDILLSLQTNWMDYFYHRSFIGLLNNQKYGYRK